MGIGRYEISESVISEIIHSESPVDYIRSNFMSPRDIALSDSLSDDLVEALKDILPWRYLSANSANLSEEFLKSTVSYWRPHMINLVCGRELSEDFVLFLSSDCGWNGEVLGTVIITQPRLTDDLKERLTLIEELKK